MLHEHGSDEVKRALRHKIDELIAKSNDKIAENDAKIAKLDDDIVQEIMRMGIVTFTHKFYFDIS